MAVVKVCSHQGRGMSHGRGQSVFVGRGVGLAFVSGGLVGAAVALLLAPQSGRESREQLRGVCAASRREYPEENIHKLAEKATEGLEQAVEKGHKFVQEKKSAPTEAVEAGRTACSGSVNGCLARRRRGGECIVTNDRLRDESAKKEKRNEYYCHRRAGVVFRWRTAHLATQRQLGIFT